MSTSSPSKAVAHPSLPKAAVTPKRSLSFDSPSGPPSKLPRLPSGALARTDSRPGIGQSSQPRRQVLGPLLGRNVAPDAKDHLGRKYDLQSVVVNFVDVGMAYAKGVLGKSPKRSSHDFDWEGVRRCVRYLATEREMQVFGVIPEDFQDQDGGAGHRCGLPMDIQLMCEMVEEALPEPYSGQDGAAREMTIERAYSRNCLYVDSGNGAAPLACDARCRAWLDRCRDLLHLRYFFDSILGTFDVFDGNVGTPTLARMNSFS